jgi:hypothetical protein
MWRWLLFNIILRTAEEFENTDEMDIKWIIENIWTLDRKYPTGQGRGWPFEM